MILVLNLQRQATLPTILIKLDAALRGGFWTMKNKDLVQLGVLMSKKQIKIIDAAAKKMGLSRSAYVRYALQRYLDYLPREQ